MLHFSVPYRRRHECTHTHTRLYLLCVCVYLAFNVAVACVQCVSCPDGLTSHVVDRTRRWMRQLMEIVAECV